jgi:hypothetical protein
LGDDLGLAADFAFGLWSFPTGEFPQLIPIRVRPTKKGAPKGAAQFPLRRRINELFYLLGYLDAQPMRAKQKQQEHGDTDRQNGHNG